MVQDLKGTVSPEEAFLDIRTFCTQGYVCGHHPSRSFCKAQMATDMVHAGTYQWCPLPSQRHTRLLTIQPPRSVEDAIYCEITTTSLESPCPYRTMSYSWGPTFIDGSHLQDIIYCDGLSMQVTKNLNMALKRFRADQKSWYRKLPIWVDAVSINHHDAVEKAAQVLMMSDIFEKARHLTIWLGEPDDDVETALCARLAQEFYDWEHNGMEMVFDPAEDQLLQSIVQRSWFRRRWVIQEVLLDSATGRTPVFRLGDYKWNWPFFVYAINQLSTRVDCQYVERFLVLAKRTTLDSTVSIPGPLTNRVYPSAAGNQNPRPISDTLLDTLQMFDYADCYDPRDRLYSLLSVGWGIGQIVVDYDADVVDVYVRFARALLVVNRDQNLAIVLATALCRRNYTSGSRDLPSWVPDWRQPMTMISSSHRAAIEWCSRRWSYSEHDGPRRFHSLDTNTNILRVQSWLVNARATHTCLQATTCLSEIAAGAYEIHDMLRSSNCSHGKESPGNVLCELCAANSAVLKHAAQQPNWP